MFMIYVKPASCLGLLFGTQNAHDTETANVLGNFNEEYLIY